MVLYYIYPYIGLDIYMTFKQIKKGLLSTFLIVAFGMYAFWNRSRAVVPAPSLPSVAISGKEVPSTTSVIPNPITALNRYFDEGDDEEGGAPLVAVRPPVTKKPSSGSTAAKAGAYKDGSYDGSASYAYTGTIQVSLVVKSGKIADVQAVDASRSGTSRQINSNALPMLKSETIQAQSENIDAVSGATYTSAAYLESLKSALSQARTI